MEEKIITYKDFREIGKNNAYFLWHFLQKDQEENNFSFYSIHKKGKERPNVLNDILPFLSIPYYESYVDENIDFLNSSGISRSVWEPPIVGQILDPRFLFKPIILLYKGYSLKSSTFQTCYCPEGLIDMLGKENPELLSGFN